MDRNVALVIVVGLGCVAVVVAPIQISYVYSGSMEPTIHQYDGYVVLEGSSVSPGDVVVFRSEEKDAYVTHRIVAETPEGYLTQGDANPSTDQASGSPPVEESAVVGRVLTVGGDPVTIPALGRAVRLLRKHAVAAAVVAVLGILLLASRSTDRPGRSVVRVDDVVRPLFVAVLVTALVAGVAGTRTVDLHYVAVDGHPAGPRTMEVGEARNETIRIERPEVPGMQVVAVGDDVVVTDRTANATTIELSVRIPPPESVGPHGGVLRVARYPATLPSAFLRRLIAVHPGLAALASALSVLGPLYLVARLALDGRTPLRPSRRRWVREWFEGES